MLFNNMSNNDITTATNCITTATNCNSFLSNNTEMTTATIKPIATVTGTTAIIAKNRYGNNGNSQSLQ